MDNYQLEPREVSVRVTTKMVKEMKLFLDKGDDYKVDWWKDQVQDSNISTVLIECEKIIKKLRSLGHYYLNETERILRESVERVTGGLERRNRQLGRRVGMFDDSVKIIITQLLSKLLVENGADED